MAGIFQISEATSLAFHSTALMLRKGEILSVKEIADEFHASEAHLSKVLQRLVKADIVHSVRGPKGGFFLKREDITLLEIYEAMEGPLTVKACLMGRKACLFKKCLFDGLLDVAAQKFKDYMDNHNISDLIN